MDFTRLRAIGSLLAMLSQGIRNVSQYNNTHPDFPMQVSADKSQWSSYFLGTVNDFLGGLLKVFYIGYSAVCKMRHTGAVITALSNLNGAVLSFFRNYLLLPPDK